jgi:hypothetical protein
MNPRKYLSIIIKQFEMIRNLFIFEKDSDVKKPVSISENQNLTKEMDGIDTCIIDNEDYKAVIGIDPLVNNKQKISPYIETEVEELKYTIKGLETNINDLSNIIADIEKQIHEFLYRHNQELGELIIQILHYRKENAKGTKQEQKTEYDYQTYSEEFYSIKNDEISVLTDEEQKIIKEKFRKASKLCHPDVVRDEQKEMATNMFAELCAAYEKNDIVQVSNILETIEKGSFFINKSEAINEKQIIEAEIQKLRFKINDLRNYIIVLKKSETYMTIKSISNWDGYFIKTKENLILELKILKHEKSNCQT